MYNKDYYRRLDAQRAYRRKRRKDDMHLIFTTAIVGLIGLTLWIAKWVIIALIVGFVLMKFVL